MAERGPSQEGRHSLDPKLTTFAPLSPRVQPRRRTPGTPVGHPGGTVYNADWDARRTARGPRRTSAMASKRSPKRGRVQQQTRHLLERDLTDRFIFLCLHSKGRIRRGHVHVPVLVLEHVHVHVQGHRLKKEAAAKAVTVAVAKAEAGAVARAKNRSSCRKRCVTLKVYNLLYSSRPPPNPPVRDRSVSILFFKIWAK